MPGAADEGEERSQVVGLPRVVVGGLALAAPAASAAPSPNWDAIIECESGGDFTAVNRAGSTASGGFQITNGTWRAYGGRKFAPLPHRATKGEQIKVAERIKRHQGWRAWPTCSQRIGVR